MNLPTFEPMPLPKVGTRSRKVMTEYNKQFLIDNFNSMTNTGLAKRLNCSIDTIIVAARKLKLKRKRYFKVISRHDLGLMLEEYFCTDCTVVYLAKKYRLSVYMASRYISYMMPRMKDETTMVLILKSKV